LPIAGEISGLAEAIIRAMPGDGDGLDKPAGGRQLLAFSDNDLLDLVMGRAAAPDRRYNYVLQLLRTA